MSETFPQFSAGNAITAAWANAVGSAIERIVDTGTAGQVLYKISAGIGPLTVGWAAPPGGTAASDTVAGIAERSTSAEVLAGTDNVRFVTPAGLAALVSTTARKGLVRLGTQAEIDAGIAADAVVTAETLSNFTGLNAGGGGANLAWNAGASTITSDTGSDAVLTVASGTNAGLMSAANFTKLASISAGAGADVTTAAVQAAGGITTTTTTVAGASFFLDETTLASNSTSKIPSQRSVKSYVDTINTALDSRIDTLESGGVSGGAGLSDDLALVTHSVNGPLAINWTNGHFFRVNSAGINIAGITETSGPSSGQMKFGLIEISNTHATTAMTVDFLSLKAADPASFQIAAGQTALIEIISSGGIGIYAKRLGVATAAPPSTDPDAPPPASSAIVFTALPQSQSVVQGSAVTMNWAATSPTSTPITYTIETEATPGSGTNGSGWWFFGTQSGASFTFSNLQLADNNTKVRITASNAVDGTAFAIAMITVTETASAPAGPVFSDTFTRANNDNIATGSTVAWVESDFAGAVETEWEIVGNQLKLVADYWASAIAGNSGAADHYAEATVGAIVGLTDVAGVLVRSNANSTQGYAAVLMSDRVRLYKSNGVYSPVFLADSRLTMTNTAGPHVVRLEAQGSSLTVKVDGVLELTHTDSSWTSGQFVGVYANGFLGTTGAYIDNFTAGIVGSGGGGAPGGGGVGLTISSVFFLGHSLMKEGFTNPFSLDNIAGDFHTPSYISTSCINQGFTCRGVYAESGGKGTDMLENLSTSRLGTTGWANADTIVIDCIVNDDSTQAQFLVTARQCNALIRSYKPAMNIVWMEGHAQSPASANTINRGVTLNPTLYTMLNAGEIEGVVPWAAYAAANPSVYYSDGVHHWNNQAPYANFMTNYLKSLTAAAPTPAPNPSTGGLPSRHIGFDSSSISHFGNPLALTGPGNVQIKGGVYLAQVFRAKETGNVTHASFNIKYNNTNGYSGGTFGKLRCHLYAANITTGQPIDGSLGQFSLNSVVAPDGNTNNGNVGKWAFNSPIAVTKGNAYAIVVENYDASPNSNFYSINLMVEYPTDGYNTPAPDMYYRDIATGNGFLIPWIKGSSYWNPDGGSTWNKYHGRTGANDSLSWHNSCFEVYYASGIRQGQAYVGARYGDADYERALSGSTRFRQSMRSLIGGRRATHLCYRSGWSREQWPSGTIVGAIVRNAAGTQLTTCDIAKNGAYWGRGQLAVPQLIAANTNYLVDIYLKSGTAPNVRAQQTSLNGHGWDADGQSNLPGDGLFVSYNGGSSFSQPGGGSAYALSLFFETVAV